MTLRWRLASHWPPRSRTLMKNKKNDNWRRFEMKYVNEQEAISETATLIAECGQRGSTCWALHEVMDSMLKSLGPWWIANFLETSTNEQAKKALLDYLETNFAAEAEIVEQLVSATHWRSTKSGFEKDFGGD